jgi:hypothetical protein
MPAPTKATPKAVAITGVETIPTPNAVEQIATVATPVKPPTTKPVI